ncbi:hypothetical protein EVAR_49397_1 [Eumeta japonica]|uniref:Uncharacterized protein n=1 Tax=Eumeta variegata TaxID=151549 RepID=A0A4C1YM12_EUMVA|nr:hypothetical protein EVAR_49397_1 [Eumeta japonica]
MKNLVEELTPTLRYRWFDYAFEQTTEESALMKFDKFIEKKTERCGRFAPLELIASEDSHPMIRNRKGKKEMEIVTSTQHTDAIRIVCILKIVPVRVTGPRGHVDTHVLLDDGSSVMLVDAALATSKGAEGPVDLLCIEAIATAFKAKTAWFESAAGSINSENYIRLRARFDDFSEYRTQLIEANEALLATLDDSKPNHEDAERNRHRTARRGPSSASSAEAGGLISRLPTSSLT